MTSSFFRLAGRSVSSALAACAVFGAMAKGQSVSSARLQVAGDDEQIILEKMVVTGSAIPVRAGRTFHPLAIVTREEGEQQGAATLPELLRSQPFFFGNVATEQRSNGGTGNAGVNLRGLAGTLTLVDGHRTAAFDEINLTPLMFLERVEIVKDGASARYGADALTGVFNQVLVPHFIGQKIQTYYGNTTDTDAGVLRLGLLTGAGNSRTDIVVGAEYYHRNALMARDREVSADADGRSRGGQNLRTGSIPARTTARRTAGGPSENLVLAPGVSAAYSAASYVPLDIDPYTSNQFYNFRETTPSIPEQENRSFYARINQKILADGRLDAHARILYSNNRYESEVTIVNSGTTLATALGNASPHLPTGLTLTGNTFLVPSSLNARGRIYERDAYDFQFGLEGRFANGWSWDATYVYGWWYRDDRQTNALTAARLIAAIQNGSYNPFALPDASGVNPNNGRSYDNPAALRAMSAVGTIDHDFGVRGGDARASGPIFELPAGPVEVAGGIDYYVTEQSDVPDPVILAPAGTYIGLNTTGYTASGYTSKGAFAELVVPVISAKMSVPLVRSLSFSFNARRTEKEVEGTTPGNGTVIKGRTFKATSPKVGVIYEVDDQLSIRSTYAEGFRTPALAFLFSASSSFNAGITDPLGFPLGGTTTPALTQGNPDLEPEKSKTWSTGVSFSPRKVSGLKFEVDYYYGKIDGLVAEGAQYIVNLNALTQGSGFVRGNPATINPAAMFAERISRNATTGTITQVRSTPFNISSREVSGLDYGISYTHKTAGGSTWSSRLQGNTTLSWDLVPIEGLPSQNWLGRFVDVGVNAISPGSIPRHRGRFMQTWAKGPWTLYGAANYVGKLEDDLSRTYRNTFRYIESWTTFDAQVAYRFQTKTGLLAGMDVRLGGTNLTDEAAPFAAGAFNDNYDVATHSNRGRFVYTSVTKRF